MLTSSTSALARSMSEGIISRPLTAVFVNTSDPETMGLAVYEGGAAGLPLCLSDIGSFRTVFKDMALYSPPREKEKLAENFLKYYPECHIKNTAEKIKSLLV